MLDRIKGILPTKPQSGQVQMNAEIGLGGTAQAGKGLGSCIISRGQEKYRND